VDTLAMARLLNVLRGGNWGLEAERRAAEAVIGSWPTAPRMIAWYEKFRAGVAEASVLAGMTAVAFSAAGFPSGDPPHAAAARASTTARFFYPEQDSAIAGQRALSLAGDGRATAFTGSFRDPAGLLGVIREAGTRDGPYQVQWGLGAMLIDADQAASLAAEYGRLLPSGSELVIAIPDGDEGRRFAVIAGACPHTASDLAAWCAEAGLDLDGPVADVRAWGREALGGELSGRGGRIVAAVARVP
jgi:S-adenosyl methyltransferase